jgi:hypothetical protein
MEKVVVKGKGDLRTMWMAETSNASSATRHILVIPPYTHTSSKNTQKDQTEKSEILLPVAEAEEDPENM